jgi:hypothetical protein
MKAKKPLLLISLALILLALALILPAAALGKPAAPNDNKPLNWVSSSENSNNDLRWLPYQGGHSLLLKELADHSLVGHMTLQIMKGEGGRVRLSTTTFSANYLFGPTPAPDVFRTENDGTKVAEFIAWFDMNGDGDPFDMPVRAVLVDGGEPPKALDTEGYWLPNTAGNDWEPFGLGVVSSVSNIQIHIGG